MIIKIVLDLQIKSCVRNHLHLVYFTQMPLLNQTVSVEMKNKLQFLWNWCRYLVQVSMDFCDFILSFSVGFMDNNDRRVKSILLDQIFSFSNVLSLNLFSFLSLWFRNSSKLYYFMMKSDNFHHYYSLKLWILPVKKMNLDECCRITAALWRRKLSSYSFVQV